MRKRKIHITILIWVLATTCLLAQNAKMKRAEKAMEALDYPTAIQIYHDILEKEDVLAAKIKLAEAYRKTTNYQNAETWYAQVVSIPDVEPINYFYYGLMLQRNDKCDQAQLWYNQFLKLKPYDYRKKFLQNACAYQEELMTKLANSLDVELPVFNSVYDDLGPAFYGNGVVFGSLNLREKSTTKPVKAFFDLYYVEADAKREGNALNLNYGAVQKFSANLNTRLHEAIVTFNENETEIFFTRNQANTKNKDEEKVILLEIMTATRLDQDKWSDLKPLSFNSEAYSVAHPALSPDGKRLYFSSDMPGGFGGKDLYLSFRENDRWGPPINLGPAINTEGDELFPFYHIEGKLFFASDGHFGLGGQDIYVIEDLGNGDWGEVENMGYPINTSFDDFGLILHRNGDFGYFTSNRKGGMGGDDIYSFRKKSLALTTQIIVVDAATGKGIAGASIKTSCGMPDLQTGVDGQLAIDLNIDNCCTIFCSMLDYSPQTLPVCVGDWEGKDTALVYVALERSVIRPPSPPVIEKLFSISGTIFDETSGLPLEGATVKLLGENCQLPRPIQTDASGEYTFEIMDDCCYQLRVEKGNYFSRTIDANICPDKKLTTRAFLKDVSLQPYLLTINERTLDKKSNITAPKFEGEEAESFELSTPTVYDDDFPTFKLNVYYESGRSSVKKESVGELKRLLRLLQDNPKLILEINSHTDSYGSDTDNNRLSQKRADNIVRWLSQMGIEQYRLIAKGYGESRLVNNCGDDIPCSEEEHQLNRRTEFKVVGTLE